MHVFLTLHCNADSAPDSAALGQWEDVASILIWITVRKEQTGKKEKVPLKR